MAQFDMPYDAST